jgi:hypothetical protein
MTQVRRGAAPQSPHTRRTRPHARTHVRNIYMAGWLWDQVRSLHAPERGEGGAASTGGGPSLPSKPSPASSAEERRGESEIPGSPLLLRVLRAYGDPLPLPLAKDALTSLGVLAHHSEAEVEAFLRAVASVPARDGASTPTISVALLASHLSLSWERRRGVRRPATAARGRSSSATPRRDVSGVVQHEKKARSRCARALTPPSSGRGGVADALGGWGPAKPAEGTRSSARRAKAGPVQLYSDLVRGTASPLRDGGGGGAHAAPASAEAGSAASAERAARATASSRSTARERYAWMMRGGLDVNLSPSHEAGGGARRVRQSPPDVDIIGWSGPVSPRECLVPISRGRPVPPAAEPAAAEVVVRRRHREGGGSGIGSGSHVADVLRWDRDLEAAAAAPALPPPPASSARFVCDADVAATARMLASTHRRTKAASPIAPASLNLPTSMRHDSQLLRSLLARPPSLQH